MLVIRLVYCRVRDEHAMSHAQKNIASATCSSGTGWSVGPTQPQPSTQHLSRPGLAACLRFWRRDKGNRRCLRSRRPLALILSIYLSVELLGVYP